MRALSLPLWALLRRLVARGPSEWLHVDEDDRGVASDLQQGGLAVRHAQNNRLFAATQHGRDLAELLNGGWLHSRGCKYVHPTLSPEPVRFERALAIHRAAAASSAPVFGEVG